MFVFWHYFEGLLSQKSIYCLVQCNLVFRPLYKSAVSQALLIGDFLAAQPQPFPVFLVTNGLHALREAGYLSEALLTVNRDGQGLLALIICVAPTRILFPDRRSGA